MGQIYYCMYNTMLTSCFHILLIKSPINGMMIVICVKIEISNFEKYKDLEWSNWEYRLNLQ